MLSTLCEKRFPQMLLRAFESDNSYLRSISLSFLCMARDLALFATSSCLRVMESFALSSTHIRANNTTRKAVLDGGDYANVEHLSSPRTCVECLQAISSLCSLPSLRSFVLSSDGAEQFLKHLAALLTMLSKHSSTFEERKHDEMKYAILGLLETLSYVDVFLLTSILV